MPSNHPAGWEPLRLGDHCGKIGSGATPRGGDRSYLPAGAARLIRSQNVLDNRFTYSGLVWIDEAAAAKLKGVRVLPGDVLLNITGQSVARCTQAPELIGEARVNQHVAIVRPDPEVLNQAFVRYWLVAHKPHLLQMASAGATREALTKTMIENFEILRPPLPEQERIVRTLRSFDDKIASNAAVWGKTVELAGALLERLAEGAQHVPLSELAGTVRTSVKPDRSPDELFAHHSIPAFDEGMWPAADLGADIGSGKYLIEGDAVLVSKLNPATRRVWWVGEPVEPRRRVASTEFVVLAPRESIPGSWVYALLAGYEPLWDQVMPNVTGTTSSHQRVRPEHYEGADVPRLGPDAREQWMGGPHNALEHARRLHGETQRLAATRDALQLRLVTGRLPAPDMPEVDLEAAVTGGEAGAPALLA